MTPAISRPSVFHPTIRLIVEPVFMDHPFAAAVAAWTAEVFA